MLHRLKAAFLQRKAFLRQLYYRNSELLHLAQERYEKASVDREHKLRAKLLNLLVNGYALKEYRRMHGFSYGKTDLPDSTKEPLAGESEPDFEEAFDRLLRDADAVTFDIVDALLFRKIARPTVIFSLIEAEQADHKGFLVERMSAESRAWHRVQDEIMLDDIYETIIPKFRHLKETELALESGALVRNEPVYALYKKAIAAGKRVAAMSNTYLPSSFLKTVLEREGYAELDGIFVAGEIRRSKCAEERIFEHVAECLGTSPSRILHVGDSGCHLAVFTGAELLHVPKRRQRLAAHKDARFLSHEEFLLPHALHNSLVMQYDGRGGYFRKLGYMLGGPLALGYLTWLDREIRLCKADCVLFTARDGWLLKQLYERFFNSDHLHTGYVYFNRILGLKAFATYLDDPHYLAILLRRANKYLGTPAPTKDFKKNLAIFQKIRDQLEDWGADLRKEMAAQANAEADAAERIVTVDMGTGRFASLSFAERIFGKRLLNAFFFMTVNDCSQKALYQSYLPQVATARDIVVTNEHIEGGQVNIMELMEILISSPEPRIIGIKDGNPVYDGQNDQKRFYGDIADGIEAYIRAFTAFVRPNSENTVSAEDWLEYARTFVQHLTEEDFASLSCIDFSAAADNESEAHKPFKPAVKTKF